jgi:hypothetical protein
VAELREQDTREPENPGFASSFASAVSGAGTSDRPPVGRRILTVALAVSVAVGGAVLAGVLLHQKDNSASTSVKTTAEQTTPTPTRSSVVSSAPTNHPATPTPKASARPVALMPSVPVGPVSSLPAPQKTATTGSTARHAAAKPAIPPASAGWTRVIQATYWLQPGASVQTNRIKLTMQTNGDLTISNPDGKVLWSSGTTGRGYNACFQADGNFVVYNSAKQPVWQSRSNGHKGAKLVLQADGNVVIYSSSGAPYWQAKTQY